MTDATAALGSDSEAGSVAADAQRRLEALAQDATPGLFVLDERQQCIYLNPAAEQLTGYTLEEVQGAPLHDIVHHSHQNGTSSPRAACPLNQACLWHIHEQGEEVLVHKDGHLYPVVYTARPIRNGTTPIGIVLEVRDISADRRIEQALTEPVRLLAFTSAIGQLLAETESLPDLLRHSTQALVDHLGATFARIWTLNDAACMLELQASAGLYTHLDGPHGRVPVGRWKIGLIAQERRPHLTNAIVDDPRVSDQEWARREGMVAFAGYPLLVEHRLVGVIGMFAREPLTEATIRALASVADGIASGIRRKQVEAELREQSDVVETINRIGQLISAELDLEKLLQAVTDAATELTGAQFGSFFYNALNDQGEAYVLYTLSGTPRAAFERFPMPRNTAVFGPTFRGEGVIRLDDVTRDPRYGREAPYHGMPPGHLPVRSYLAIPVVSRSGEVFGGLFFGHAEPGVFTARSERLVVGIAAQASIAIDNARLFAQARDAIRLRDEFLSIASHELRNPVAGIKGAAQMLRRTIRRGQLDAERLDRYVGIVDITATRLARLTEDLLDVSRLRTGGLPLRPQSTDLAELIDAIMRRMPASGDRERVMLNLESRPCMAVADPDRLEQVVENLLSNAIKYAPDGGEIQVALTRDGDDVVLRVQDSGIGLPHEALERIFEPFGRAPNAVSRNIEGLGLGLYICRQIVEQHGGNLRATSAGEGRGTTMLLRLPISGPSVDTQGGAGTNDG